MILSFNALRTYCGRPRKTRMTKNFHYQPSAVNRQKNFRYSRASHAHSLLPERVVHIVDQFMMCTFMQAAVQFHTRCCTIARSSGHDPCTQCRLSTYTSVEGDVRVLAGDVVDAHAGGVVAGIPEPAGIVEAGEGRLLGDGVRDGVVVCGVPEAGGKGKKRAGRTRTTEQNPQTVRKTRKKASVSDTRPARAAAPATARAEAQGRPRGSRPRRDTRG